MKNNIGRIVTVVLLLGTLQGCKTREKCNAAYTLVDVDQNNLITREEFAAIPQKYAMIGGGFNVIDIDQSGDLSPSEVGRVCDRLDD